MSTREERLEYERRILAAEVETVRLARRTKRFLELMRRNTGDIDAALCVANQALDRRGHDRLVVEPWMPCLLSLLDDINQIIPEQFDNQNRLLSEKQPKSVVSDSAVERLSYYEREVPGLPDTAPVTITMGDLRELLAPIEAFGGDAEERLHREATKAGSRLPTTPSPLSPIKEGS